VLVVGYGSIGKRHCQILSTFPEIDDIQVVSSQLNLPYVNNASLAEAVQYEPDYIVIASETSKHLENLKFIIDNYETKNILIEKPLFSQYCLLDNKNKNIFVGYNLRFHPLIQSLKDLIIGHEIKGIYCSCHTYLPEWREGVPYQDSYSSYEERGGGVILDLSHEIDLLMWLFGSIEIDFIKYGNFSNLELKSEDSLFLAGHLENQGLVELSLSYFSLLPKREIHIVTNELTILVDLINNTITFRDINLAIKREELDPFQMNNTYIAQHKEILSGLTCSACTYSEGLEVNKFIDQIKSWKKS